MKLEQEGFEVQLADNGKLGVELVETMQPDGWLSCLVSDVSTLKATESRLRDAHDEAVREYSRALDMCPEFVDLRVYLAGTPAVLGTPTVIPGVGVTHLRYPVRGA